MKGTYSIYTDKAGGEHILCRVYVEGKQYGATGASKMEARQKATIKAYAPKPDVPTGRQMPLSTHMEAWLDAGEKHWAASTARGNRQNYERFIKKQLGAVPLGELTPALLQTWVRSLPTLGYQHRCRKLLRWCLAEAVDLEILERNPCRNLKVPREDGRQPQAWDAAQALAFWNLPKELHYQAYFVLALSFPARPEEILGLRWGNVGLTDGTVRVVEARATFAGVTVAGKTKTPESRRTVNIGPEALEVLRRWKAVQGEQRLGMGRAWHGEDLVCTNAAGEPMHYHSLYKVFVRLAKAAGLPPIHLYELRHTVITGWGRGGIPIEVASSAAGHANSRITQAIYRRVHQDERRDAALAWSQMLHDSATGPISASS